MFQAHFVFNPDLPLESAIWTRSSGSLEWKTVGQVQLWAQDVLVAPEAPLLLRPFSNQLGNTCIDIHRHMCCTYMHACIHMYVSININLHTHTDFRNGVDSSIFKSSLLPLGFFFLTPFHSCFSIFPTL